MSKQAIALGEGRQTCRDDGQLNAVRIVSSVIAAVLFSMTYSAGQTTAAPARQTPLETFSYSPITGKQRIDWVVKGTIGPQSLATGLFTAAIQTAENRPREYGPHWDGYGKRYGLRLTGVGTEHVMEASVGALWGEDPRYFRSQDSSFRGRIKNVMVMTVSSRRTDGHLAPAYARFIAMPASNFASNAWRPDSISNSGDAWGRTLYGFLAKLAGNAFAEFWPDAKRRIFHSSRRGEVR